MRMVLRCLGFSKVESLVSLSVTFLVVALVLPILKADLRQDQEALVQTAKVQTAKVQTAQVKPAQVQPAQVAATLVADAAPDRLEPAPGPDGPESDIQPQPGSTAETP